MELVREVWKNINRKAFITFSIILVILLIAEIIATVLLPVWKQYFYNGIEAKDFNVFYNGVVYFCLLVTLLVLSQGFKVYIGQRVSLLIRTALVKVLYFNWLGSNHKLTVDNPDQRINEDTFILTDLSLRIIIEVLISLFIIFGLMIQMLDNLSLFSISLVYTVLVLVCAWLFKNPMVSRDILVKKTVADHRFSLAQIRLGEKIKAHRKYSDVILAYLEFIKIQLYYSLFHQFKSRVTTVVALVILVPLYLTDQILFGDVMKGASQFELTVINATILMYWYPEITLSIASYQRIKDFYQELKRGEHG